jgi:hypothetical protein
MKAKSNKQSKGPKHHPPVKDIPTKGNPLGGMGNFGGGGGGTTPSRLLDP